MEITEPKKIRSYEVAKRWGIPHIIDVEDHEKWKLAFMQLGAATVMLERAHDHIANQESTIDMLNEEIQIYLQAIDRLCEDSDCDIEMVIAEARSTFEQIKKEET